MIQKGVPGEERRLSGDHPQSISVDDQRLVLLNDQRNHLFQRAKHDGMTPRSRPNHDRIDSLEKRQYGLVVRFTDLRELIALFGRILQLNDGTHNQLWRVTLDGYPRFFRTNDRDKIGSLGNGQSKHRLRHVEQQFQRRTELPCTRDILQ